jgi:UDP-glucose 4-epimerase
LPGLRYGNDSAGILKEMDRSILVTGGAGFIGSHLVHALLSRGDHVRVLDNFSTGRRENLTPVLADVELVEGDVRDEALTERAAAGVEAILHQAALPSVALSFEHPGLVESVNGGGTATILRAARRCGVRRVVLASSCAVYGDAANCPISEDTPPSPLSPYAVGKLAAEWYLRVMVDHSSRQESSPGECSEARGVSADDWATSNGRIGPDAVALRYFNVFGPRQDPRSEYSGVIARFLDAAATDRPCTLHGDGHQTRDFVFVGDVVLANLLALECEQAAGRAFNVGSGAETSLLDLASGIEAACGRRLQFSRGPAREGDIRRSCADIGLARRLLGFEPQTTLFAGLQETLAWYLELHGGSRG